MVTFALCTLLAFTAAAPQQQGQQQNGLFNCLTQVGCEREDYIGIWTAKLADTTTNGFTLEQIKLFKLDPVIAQHARITEYCNGKAYPVKARPSMGHFISWTVELPTNTRTLFRFQIEKIWKYNNEVIAAVVDQPLMQDVLYNLQRLRPFVSTKTLWLKNGFNPDEAQVQKMMAEALKQ